MRSRSARFPIPSWLPLGNDGAARRRILQRAPEDRTLGAIGLARTDKGHDSFEAHILPLVTARPRDASAEKKATGCIIDDGLPRCSRLETCGFDTGDIAMNNDARDGRCPAPEIGLLPIGGGSLGHKKENVSDRAIS